MRMSCAPWIALLGVRETLLFVAEGERPDSSVWPGSGLSVPWPVSQIQSASGSRPASFASVAFAFFFTL